jgi:5'-nucleotidase
MRILISNDDGIESPGLLTLKGELEKEHEVWVTAPDRERSGMSHSITLRDPVRFRQVAARMYACDGTPADTVLYSLLGALPVQPDIIISGINRGPNLGTDIIYSGTAAAARQGALVGIPSIAVSVAPIKPPFPFEKAAKFVRNNIQLFLELWSSDHFINVNFPPPSSQVNEVSITHPSRRIYSDKAESFQSPNGDKYYFLTGESIHAREEEGSDWNAVQAGKISVSPVYLHPMNHEVIHTYQEAQFDIE